MRERTKKLRYFLSYEGHWSSLTGSQLVSSKQLTTFSDFRHPSGGDFLSAPEYVSYLERYCTQFNLWPHIKLNTRVTSVTRTGTRNHRVAYEEDGAQLTWDCDAIAVCSGLHVEPNIPNIEGIENAPRVIHSSHFKARKQFLGRRTVLVVGCGETGADVSYLAVTCPQVERVIVCHRDGFHFAPKVSINNAPQLFHKSLTPCSETRGRFSCQFSVASLIRTNPAFPST